MFIIAVITLLLFNFDYFLFFGNIAWQSLRSCRRAPAHSSASNTPRCYMIFHHALTELFLCHYEA